MWKKTKPIDRDSLPNAPATQAEREDMALRFCDAYAPEMLWQADVKDITAEGIRLGYIVLLENGRLSLTKEGFDYNVVKSAEVARDIPGTTKH